MKFLAAPLIFIFILTQTVFAQKENNDILGNWATEKGKIIKIIKQENLYEGATLDGAAILKDLTYSGNSWKGTIQNRSGDKSAKCNVVMQSDDKLKITAHKGILKKRFYWTRKKQ